MNPAIEAYNASITADCAAIDWTVSSARAGYVSLTRQCRWSGLRDGVRLTCHAPDLAADLTDCETASDVREVLAGVDPSYALAEHLSRAGDIKRGDRFGARNWRVSHAGWTVR